MIGINPLFNKSDEILEILQKNNYHLDTPLYNQILLENNNNKLIELASHIPSESVKKEVIQLIKKTQNIYYIKVGIVLAVSCLPITLIVVLVYYLVKIKY